MTIRVPASSGPVGVLDVDRDARLADGEHGLVVQHGRAHVGQLALLPVGDLLDGAGVLDQARVGHQQAGNVGPVLVHGGMDGAGDDGPGHVRPAAREALDLALRVLPVEAGDDRDPALGDGLASRAPSRP